MQRKLKKSLTISKVNTTVKRK